MNLRINGLPEKQDEDCEDLVVRVAKCIGAHVDTKDIDRAHRTGKSEPNKVRSIICRFNNFKARKDMTICRKKLKETDVIDEIKTEFEDLELGDEPKVYVNDDLTKAKSALAAGVRQKKRDDKIKETWISYGKIFAKLNNDKVLVIKNKDDLNSLPN